MVEGFPPAPVMVNGSRVDGNPETDSSIGLQLHKQWDSSNFVSGFHSLGKGTGR